jgi:anti-sigma factor RsiW
MKPTWGETAEAWSEVMAQKFLILAAAAATVAVTSLAVTSSAEAHHRFYRHYSAYRFAPWYAPRYGYAAPYRYYDRFGSNLNPDRQMVGIGE